MTPASSTLRAYIQLLILETHVLLSLLTPKLLPKAAEGLSAKIGGELVLLPYVSQEKMRSLSA